MSASADLYAGSDPRDAWAVATTAEFGQISTWNPEAGKPMMGFLHYVVQDGVVQNGVVQDSAVRDNGEDSAQGAVRDNTSDKAFCLLGHLANTNPMLALLKQEPRATFFVQGPAVYIPSYWGGNPRGVPTSYYQWAQFEVEVELVSDHAGLLDILGAMLVRFQPEGQLPPLDPADKYWQGLLGAITGLRMHVADAQSRHKLGQNKPAAHREAVVEGLRQRGNPQDRLVAQQVLARLPQVQVERSGAGG